MRDHALQDTGVKVKNRSDNKMKKFGSVAYK